MYRARASQLDVLRSQMAFKECIDPEAVWRGNS